MEKIIVELEAKTDKAIKGIDDVAKSVENLNKDVVDSNKDTAKALKGVESATKSVSGGIKKIGTSIKAAGLGLLIVAFGTIKELFSQNQKAVDLFNTAFEATSIVVGQVINAFTDIYNAVSSSRENFDALGKVLDGVLTLVLAPFKATFQGIKLALQSAQLAWEESFFGDKDPETIKRLNAEIKVTKENLSEVADGVVEAGKSVVNNFGEAVTEVGNVGVIAVKELSKISVSAAVDTAKANVELQKSAELAAATQGLLFEKFDRQAEKLRQVRDEERNSIADRKKANDELLVKINEAEVAMLSQAKQQLAIANANLEKDAQNVEFKVAQIEAIKELAAVEAQIEGIRSEQKANDLALDREQIELTNSKAESESNLSIERKRFNAELIQDELAKLEALKVIDDLEKEQESLRLQAIVENANAGTQAKIDAQIALDEFTEQSRQTNLTRDEEISEAKVADAKAVADAEAAIRQGNLNNIGAGFALLGQLAGKNKALQSAALIGESAVGIAKTVINTQAANSAAVLKYALLPGGIALASAEKSINNIGAGISIATNIAATAKGLSQLGGGGSTPSKPSLSSGGGGSVPSIPPAFNVVGASDTNQLADAIGGQSQQPTRAYVVSNDVTTAQSMDRNIVDGASI